MNAAIGQSAVVLGLLASLAGAFTLAVGLTKKRPSLLRAGRSYTWLILAGAVMAALAMERGFLTHDFSLTFVAHNSSRSTPLLYLVTGMWSALEGSIVLWTLILAGYIAAMARKYRARIDDPMVGWATLVTYVVSAFFFLLMVGPANPFRTISGAIPSDGPGPNPLLQNHPLVAFHPPMLYLGFVGFTIPFAFAVASLVTGRMGEGWLIDTRRWTLFAWGFLSAGIVLGAWWSYEVLGWGGFWAWDPVENASFLPWITATAYLHSVMVQERRGMLRLWNLSLLLATFSLTILGTFLTRSGVLQSVHAFTTSGIGPLILGFFGLTVAVTITLIAWRGDRLRSPGTIDSPVSREGAFLANNLLFAAFAFVVLLGTVFPLLSEAINGQQISVGEPYFDRMTMPIMIALLFLMAIAPVLPWRKASGELLRKRIQWPLTLAVTAVVLCVVFGVRGLNPLLVFGLGAFAAGSAGRQLVLAARRQGWRGLVGRANGGMIVHIGVVVIAVAFAGSRSFAHQTQQSVSAGQTIAFAGHKVTYLGTEQVTHANRLSQEAKVRIDGSKVYRPAISQYTGGGAAIATPAVRSTPLDDVYIKLVDAPLHPGGPATIGVIIQPLIMWLWIGGGIVGLGTLLAAWPGRRRRPVDPVSAPVAGAPDAVGNGARPLVGAADRAEPGGSTEKAPAPAAPDSPDTPGPTPTPEGVPAGVPQ
ncbi:MAG: cytochrome c-type biosis protein CcmF [Acidimicrobiaceae bacterium]|nr:cytochrome c-type biosis protein CcmF [Acidimicrobiaceae bacterium]